MVKEVAENVWNLSPEDAGAYLIAGTEACLLLDTGFPGAIDFAALLPSLTKGRPVQLVNTHFHGDHSGGNKLFPTACAHPADFPGLREASNTLLPIHEGQAFDLGGRELTVLETPGHTPGGISLLDKAARLLFTGDNVATVPIWMQNPGAELEVYIKTLDRYLAMEDQVDLVLGCHGAMPQKIGLCRDLKALALDVLADRIPGTVIELSSIGGPPGAVRLFEKGGVSMLRAV